MWDWDRPISTSPDGASRTNVTSSGDLDCLLEPTICAAKQVANLCVFHVLRDEGVVVTTSAEPSVRGNTRIASARGTTSPLRHRQHNEPWAGNSDSPKKSSTTQGSGHSKKISNLFAPPSG